MRYLPGNQTNRRGWPAVMEAEVARGKELLRAHTDWVGEFSTPMIFHGIMCTRIGMEITCL